MARSNTQKNSTSSMTATSNKRKRSEVDNAAGSASRKAARGAKGTRPTRRRGGKGDTKATISEPHSVEDGSEQAVYENEADDIREKSIWIHWIQVDSLD